VRAAKSDLTSGTEWLRDEEAASVVTERAATAKGAAILARAGKTLGAARVSLRALENIARSVNPRSDLEVEGG
jgi:hypothetical protein